MRLEPPDHGLVAHYLSTQGWRLRTIKIDPRKLRYGAHKLSITTIMSDTACANLARAGVFVHPHPPIVKPKFTG
jgi:hypothetical protein